MSITPADLAAALGIGPAGPADAAWLAESAAGVTAYVDALPHVTPGAWDDRTRTGALLLATDVYQSRSAAAGAAAIDVTGGFVAGKVSGQVGRLLRVGPSYGRPRAG